MTQIFLQIINMSISASYIVLAVLLLRLLLKKAPKWISVVLWGIVAVRLVCPFTVESVLSLIPSAEVVSPSIMTDTPPTVNTGIPFVNSTLNPVIGESFAPAPGDSANPLRVLVPVFAVIWIVGMVALLIYTVISYARVKRRIGTAVLFKDNIYQSEGVVSPFVLGLIKPKIYLPFNMKEQDVVHVVAHEQAHIRRRDYLWKPFGFLLLILHWFNPLMWLGYVLLCRDIELACDEKVIGALDREARADYSEALLSCSINRRMIAACPLAFGEVGVKERVRSVLSYKKPAFWLIVAALAACVAVAVCFLTDPVREKRGETDPEKLTDAQIALMEQYPEYFGLDATGGLDVYVWQFAEKHYSFGLLPHSAEGRNWLADELMALRGVSADTMRAILATYDIDEDEIYVVPWQNPLSSYLAKWQIVLEGEDPEAYVDAVREMLFGEVPPEDTEITEEEAPYTVPLVYAEPTLSWVRSEVPAEILIAENVLLDVKCEQPIGTVEESELTRATFDRLIAFGGEYGEVAEALLQNNDVAYEVEPFSPDSVDLYYVLMQKDGTTLLVYGHYENGEKTDFIRWIFCIDKAS